MPIPFSIDRFLSHLGPQPRSWCNRRSKMSLCGKILPLSSPARKTCFFSVPEGPPTLRRLLIVSYSQNALPLQGDRIGAPQHPPDACEGPGRRPPDQTDDRHSVRDIIVLIGFLCQGEIKVFMVELTPGRMWRREKSIATTRQDKMMTGNMHVTPFFWYGSSIREVLSY